MTILPNSQDFHSLILKCEMTGYFDVVNFVREIEDCGKDRGLNLKVNLMHSYLTDEIEVNVEAKSFLNVEKALEECWEKNR